MRLRARLREIGKRGKPIRPRTVHLIDDPDITIRWFKKVMDSYFKKGDDFWIEKREPDGWHRID